MNSPGSRSISYGRAVEAIVGVEHASGIHYGIGSTQKWSRHRQVVARYDMTSVCTARWPIPPYLPGVDHSRTIRTKRKTDNTAGERKGENGIIACAGSAVGDCPRHFSPIKQYIHVRTNVIWQHHPNRNMHRVVVFAVQCAGFRKCIEIVPGIGKDCLRRREGPAEKQYRNDEKQIAPEVCH